MSQPDQSEHLRSFFLIQSKPQTKKSFNEPKFLKIDRSEPEFWRHREKTNFLSLNSGQINKRAYKINHSSFRIVKFIISNSKFLECTHLRRNVGTCRYHRGSMHLVYHKLFPTPGRLERITKEGILL
jgi:hypothetical protein